MEQPTAIKFSHESDRLYQYVLKTLKGKSPYHFESIENVVWLCSKEGVQVYVLPLALGRLVAQYL